MTIRNVLITGGANGIGLGIAKFLGQKGHYIVIADLHLDAAKKAVEMLNKAGIKAHAIALDVGNAEDIETLPARLLPVKIDVLINNAGIQHVAKLEDFPAATWQKPMMSKAFLPQMRDSNFGRIINIGSLHSVVASPFKSAYVAAKHGLLGFAKTLALETGDCDVTVNTLCPAYVKTQLVEQQIASQALENGISEQDVINKIMLEPMPKKAFIEIDELAESVDFLISRAARNITAQAIVLDGGWTAR
jgi:3-hydroxybutyrate dehydrogenase